METARTPASPRVEHDNADRDRRECTHPGSPHRHGTRNAYVTDGCHCTECRAANRADERHRTESLRNGQWEPLVDAAPARGHLQLLRHHGLGLDQIVKISETSKTHHPPSTTGTAHITASNPVRNRPTGVGHSALTRTPGAPKPGGRHRNPRLDPGPDRLGVFDPRTRSLPGQDRSQPAPNT